jgi:ribosomal 30S subunit maturation factor RimM
MTENQWTVSIGKVVGTFGLKGEVKVYVTTDEPEYFDPRRAIKKRLGIAAFGGSKISCPQFKRQVSVGLHLDRRKRVSKACPVLME